MKYGDTLQRRSIPEWETYNVDYNEIKKLIKERTSKPQGPPTAIAIPGQDFLTPESAFENELFDELADQYLRIELFVRSKSGEIKRRLEHLSKSVERLRRKNEQSAGKHIPVRRLEKFSKIESEVLQAGETIQSLARFVGAQQLAFVKLLKKYRKWTRSICLGQRFHKEVQTTPTAFSQTDLDPVLALYTEVLAAVRAPFIDGFKWDYELTNDSQQQHGDLRIDTGAKACSELFSMCQSGKNVEVDTALAALPLGRKAGHAAYWIHYDNMVEIQVLLLQYARVRDTDIKKSSNSIPTRARNSEAITKGEHSADNGRDMKLIICDDPESFGRRRNGVTIKDIESLPGRKMEEAAASIHYSFSGEAIVVFGQTLDKRADSASGNDSLQAVTLKMKAVRSLFQPSELGNNSGSAGVTNHSGNGFEKVREWLAKHREVRPLANIQSSRTRYIGLGNSKDQGLWATLDKDVSMVSFSIADLAKARNPSVKGDVFPHAVLEVRWEGQTAPAFVDILDKSHLVERVPGFSLETHAVATLCKPIAMPVPFWLDALKRDIRKLPSTESTPRRGSVATATPDSTRTQPTSATAASVIDGPSSSNIPDSESEAPVSPITPVPDILQNPPLGAFRKKRRNRKLRLENQQFIAPRLSKSQRYWNEFDDGDERPTEDEYTLLVDPNTSVPFSGLWSAVSSFAVAASEKLRSSMPTPSTKDERQGLLNSKRFRPSNTTDASDNDSDSPPQSASPTRSQFFSRYSAFPSFHELHDPLEPLSARARDQRDALLTNITFGAFFISIVLLAVAGTLLETRRKKYVVSADIATLVGVMASFLSAAVGVITSAARTGSGGLLAQAQVGVAFALVCVLNGVIILIMFLG